jgi:hypothetical protein
MQCTEITQITSLLFVSSGLGYVTFQKFSMCRSVTQSLTVVYGDSEASLYSDADSESLPHLLQFQAEITPDTIPDHVRDHCR